MDQAKQLFWDYACSHFFMAHAGVRDQYLPFGATEERERQWRREFIAVWIARLATTDPTALNKLSNADAIEAVEPIMALAQTGDDYSKLWYANAIWNLVTRNETTIEIRVKAAKLCKMLWSTLGQGAPNIDASHLDNILPHLE